ncbi:branched-chain amino acid ABC transporter permease [Rhodospirillum sp. A1_3_36]|uniref:branched-chain amino acid ABC transporter permease n=1 Tax=Rhodospirillum sp. A1_3_36 TaxID=3391666 RepID=UPI0039A4B569
MDSTIALFLAQDGITNGAIYALLGLSLVLVFTVTRVIFIPQGEFVAYGALTLVGLETGVVPGTAYLTLVLGIAAFCVDLVRTPDSRQPRVLITRAVSDLGLPLALLGVSGVVAPANMGPWVNVPLAVALVAPMGAYIYRLAFRPLAQATVLTLLIAAVGVHLVMLGLGLVFFGAEGYRATPFTDVNLSLGVMDLGGQSLWVLGVTAVLIVALWYAFGHTLAGKALRATSINRLGATLVGIPTAQSGLIAFVLAATLGAISGVLIAPITTIFYDSGFLIGLKGFVAAIIGGLVSYPISAAAAILVGLVEAFASFEASSFKEVIVFTIIIPVLLWQSLRSGHVDEEEE